MLNEIFSLAASIIPFESIGLPQHFISGRITWYPSFSITSTAAIPNSGWLKLVVVSGNKITCPLIAATSGDPPLALNHWAKV